MSDAELVKLLKTEKAGFKLIQVEAERVLRDFDSTSCVELAQEFYESEAYQARMFAVLIFGRLAASNPVAYETLRGKVIHDPDWRTQEMLARAFDQYCSDKGYEGSLAVIKEWLTAAEPKQRRAASEGLRIWTSRPYFKEHPDVAITLLSSLRADDSEYVRKSVGNALRDISKRYPELVKKELETWNLDDPSVAFTSSLASKFIT